MHPSAQDNCKLFFDVYAPQLKSAGDVNVIEIGSQDVNGSLRSACPENFKYLGVDFVEGRGVDVVLTDPYKLPFDDESADIVLSSSCFEHSEMFWLLFLEIIRILKPNGLFYLNVPSNGMFHRYPVDCWRFYPDSGKALVAWSARNGYKVELVESFISLQSGGSSAEHHWNDYVAIFAKPSETSPTYSNFIVEKKSAFINGITHVTSDFVNKSDFSEDFWKLWHIKLIIENQIPSNDLTSADQKIGLISQIVNNQIKIKS